MLNTEEISQMIRSSAYYDPAQPHVLVLTDPKLRYLSGEQAQEWMRFGSFDNIHTLSHEVELLKQHILERMIGPHGTILVDLGCGDGAKAAQLIKALRSRGLRVSSYYAVDINQTLIETAISRVRSCALLSPDQCHASCTSFESLALSREMPWGSDSNRSEGSPVLLLFLGNTYNNYDSRIITQLLDDISSVQDTLLIGAKVRPRTSPTSDPGKFADEYRSFGDSFTFSLGHLLGLQDHEMVRKVLYNSHLNCAEIWLLATRPIVLRGVPPVDRVLVFRSYRPAVEEMCKQLEERFTVECWRSESNEDAIFHCLKS